MIGVGASLEGYLFRKCNPIERVLLAAAGLLLIVPGLRTDLIGLATITVVAVSQLVARRMAARRGD